jgi:protein-S-isoprenylcysteine O-methyltransferase Ste14
MTDLNFRALRSSVLGVIVFAALLFLPAWTLDYWQAWVFLAVWVVSSTAVTVYLARKDPALLERRMKVGPRAEKEKSQKLAVLLIFAGFLGLMVVPAFDRRFHWSTVPTNLTLAGDALVALGFLFIFFVVRENSYSAATIQVAEDQKVISTGPYARLRHPMYSGALLLSAGIPLALGSWWGLLGLILMVPALVWRIVNEEQFLKMNLPGYAEYTNRVRYRLVPSVW